VNAQRTALSIRIVASGTPFDPTTQGEADTTLSAEERSIGGLGIHMIRHYMDEVSYQYIDGHNVLTMKKNLKSNNNTK
jgi:anti-sigma regulatory factor (Ser/Thr protein kinase)